MSSEQIAEQDPLISLKEEEIVALKKQLEEWISGMCLKARPIDQFTGKDQKTKIRNLT